MKPSVRAASSHVSPRNTSAPAVGLAPAESPEAATSAEPGIIRRVYQATMRAACCVRSVGICYNGFNRDKATEGRGMMRSLLAGIATAVVGAHTAPAPKHPPPRFVNVAVGKARPRNPVGDDPT